MTIVTLVKVVPELDRMAFDPATKTMRRAGAPLELNPFDEHAALVAPALRRAGEASVVVCMGPPDAKASILRALALGSDRAILISDRALAGSDTLVTSRALAAALRPLGADIILAGRWSTDSSTGQVTSQLAEMLDLPMVGGARRVARTSDRTLEVVGETAEGWAKYEVETPCVVTVTEKISRIRFPKSKDLEEAGAKPFEIQGIGGLGLAPGEVGLSGSPTQVLSLENEEPVRNPMVLADGALDARVRRAADRIQELLSGPRPAPAELRGLRGSPEEQGEVLILASSDDGGLDPGALPLVSEVLRLPEPLWPSVVGFGELTAQDSEALARAGAVRAYWRPETRDWVPPAEAARFVSTVLGGRPKAAGGFFLSTEWGREVAGRVSGRLGLGLTGDAVAVSWDPGRGLVYHKPSFGGGLVARVVSKRPPSLATIRPGSLPPGGQTTRVPSLEVVAYPAAGPSGRISRLETGTEKDPKFGDVDRSRIVVGIGMGVGGPANVDSVLEAIRPLGAALAATRRVVDSGWVPFQLQVGLTGKSIAPDLYIAVGVSGAVNHLVGVKRARVTVGINTKSTEPLFSHVDVGIVGEGLETLRALVPLLGDRLYLGGNRPSAPPSA